MPIDFSVNGNIKRQRIWKKKIKIKTINVKATIDAVTGLVKAAPVYQDTLQPAAKQIGQSLETVTKTVNIALVPTKVLVWGYEEIFRTRYC